MYGVLEWLLRNLADLKKRAYLAGYLMRIEVPPDLLAADAQVHELYQQVRKTFKN